jgi:hypothetical protein
MTFRQKAKPVSVHPGIGRARLSSMASPVAYVVPAGGESIVTIGGAPAITAWVIELLVESVVSVTVSLTWWLPATVNVWSARGEAFGPRIELPSSKSHVYVRLSPGALVEAEPSKWTSSGSGPPSDGVAVKRALVAMKRIRWMAPAVPGSLATNSG